MLENRSKPVTCVWTPILHPDAYKTSPIPGVIAWACVFQELGFSSVWTLVLFLLSPFSAFHGFGSFRRDYEDSRHHPGLRALVYVLVSTHQYLVFVSAPEVYTAFAVSLDFLILPPPPCFFSDTCVCSVCCSYCY